MTKWILLIAFIISGSVLGVMYHQLGKLSAESGAESSQNPNAIRIVDGYKDGIHRLNGTIKLPHSCFALKTDASVYQDAPGVVAITITTKDNMLEQSVCANIRTRYPFETVIEAEKDISIRLFVDENELPTAVTQVDWLNPSGNVVESSR